MSAIEELLKIAVERKASDLHLTVGLPPQLRIDGGIFELRFSGRDSDFRVLYFFDGNRVIFTNVFKKKTQKTPRNEMELAADRRHLYLSSKSIA